MITADLTRATEFATLNDTIEQVTGELLIVLLDINDALERIAKALEAQEKPRTHPPRVNTTKAWSYGSLDAAKRYFGIDDSDS